MVIDPDLPYRKDITFIGCGISMQLLLHLCWPVALTLCVVSHGHTYFCNRGKGSGDSCYSQLFQRSVERYKKVP